jgi:hypothetical protein
MRVLLLGPGSNSFPAALDEAGIRYEKHTPRPPPGVIVNATGEILHFVEHVVTATSLATVLVAWIHGRASRKIIVTTKDEKVIHIEGYSVEQFEKILADAREVSVIDTQKSA